MKPTHVQVVEASTNFTINKLCMAIILDLVSAVNMNSPYQNPFDKPVQQQLQRNYSDVFKAEDYECKDSLELESYARNLRNYLMGLLQQDPFPAFLFEKLEKRLDGIVSILTKRSAASNVLGKNDARARLKQLDALLNKAVEIETVTSQQDTPEPPLKKRRVDPMYVDEVRKSDQALKQTRDKANDKFIINDDEEEEEDQSTQNT